MSFSWTIKGVGGVDLLEKYGIHSQGLGLAPNAVGDTDARYRLNDIRNTFVGASWKEEFPKAAQVCVEIIKSMLRENLETLTPHHCKTCTCTCKPCNWDLEQIHRFLSIPTNEIRSAGGGY